MKKIFTVFCAICLMPTFSAQAWIGGPFSNNSFFGEDGDDGVYEAAASAFNGIGLYRIVVGNDFDGVNPKGVSASVPSQIPVPGINTVTVPGISSGNVVIGAYGSSFSNVWYYEGVFFTQVSTLGTASSVMGTVNRFCGGKRWSVGLGLNTLSSSFIANFQGTGKFLPARVFSGSGQGQIGARFTVRVRCLRFESIEQNYLGSVIPDLGFAGWLK
jgi:hypothetical protein